MMKSIAVHCKNKYPGARVDFSEDHVSVYDQDGNLLVAVRRGGGGVLVDQSKELGARYEHDLSPIPKNSRVFKLNAEGRIELDEKHAERKPIALGLASLYQGRVPSIAQLKNAGYEFDGDSVAVQQQQAPAQQQEQPAQPPVDDSGDDSGADQDGAE